MRMKKWLTPIIVVFTILFILGACGHIEQKPTGLEDTKSDQIKNVATDDVQEVEDEEIKEDDEVDSEEKFDEDNEKGNSDEKNSEKDTERASNKDSEKTKNKQSNQSDQNQSTSEHISKSTEDQPKNKKKSSNKKSNKNTGDTPEHKTKDKDKNKETKRDSKTDSSSEGEEKEQNPPPKKSKDTIELSIVVSSNEVILPAKEFEITSGDNVLKVLNEVTKESEIQRSIVNGYVSSIGNVAEKEHGSESGWMYRVNGTFPNIGAASYTLEDGDVVEWLYTKDLGKDIGAP